MTRIAGWGRRGARALGALSTVTAVAVAVMAAMPAAAQDQPPADDGSGADATLATSYVDAYGWWSKVQQSPTGGQNVPSQSCSATETPASSSECAAGPPADGLYVVYDYQAVVPPAVTGPVGNLPAAPQPSPPAGAPVSDPSTPQPLGQSAYGAVRFVVPEGAETELSLRLLSKQSSTPGGQDPSNGTVFGCAVTTPGWAGQQNGRYDQAPGFDCSSADQADVNGDTLVFDFPAGMVQNGLLDVAIVGAGDRPFQMAIDKPTDTSLVITNAADLFATTDDADVSSDEVAFEDPTTSFEDASGAVTVDPSFGGDVAFSTDEALLPSVAAPSARPQAQRAVTAGRVANPLGPDASRGERIMAVALLLAMGLALWWIGGGPARVPRLLGSLGGRGGEADAAARDHDDDGRLARPGGIGRFVRPRDGRPPRLY